MHAGRRPLFPCLAPAPERVRKPIADIPLRTFHPTPDEARHNMWGLSPGTAPTCMLVLAVAAGESGANPELSRNGVIGVLLCTRESEDLPTARPARPSRKPHVRASRRAGGRRTQGCPHPGTVLPGSPAPAGPEPSEG
ncbi:hypothetical protein GCM10010392_05430 [Streptomyces clavifer]|nr:hypothetical protein GCM10010392_05430 [Streptomyces clavifer]